MTQNSFEQRRRRNAATGTQRRGVALIEIMVAMVVVTIGLLGTAGMTAAAARRASGLSFQSTRDGIVLQEMNRIASITFDSLASRVGCTAVNSSVLSHTRCIAVTDMTGNYKRVRIIITPSTTYARAETVYVNRSRGALPNPLPQ
jgi:prepilin-type N-terminal cleavage/methylation domain-containing protein